MPRNCAFEGIEPFHTLPSLAGRKPLDRVVLHRGEVFGLWSERDLVLGP